MNPNTKLFVAAVFGCIAFSASAQPSKLPQGGFPEKITRADALKQAGEGFDRVDTNHDGVVTRVEMQAYREKMQAAMSTKGSPVAPAAKSLPSAPNK
jgi:hypothetical protein